MTATNFKERFHSEAYRLKPFFINAVIGHHQPQPDIHSFILKLVSFLEFT